MAEGTVHIEIAAPVGKVFDFIADVETHPLYDGDFVEKVEVTSKRRRGKGVTFRQLRRGSETYTDSEIIEFVPDTRIVWVARTSKGDVFVSYRFEKTLSGTRVIHSVSSPLLDDPERVRLSYEENEKELSNLKALLERA